jgi:hypothetical protein
LKSVYPRVAPRWAICQEVHLWGAHLLWIYVCARGSLLLIFRSMPKPAPTMRGQDHE